MPELPEVETVARQLDPQLRGRRLSSIEILDAKLAGPDWDSLRGFSIQRTFRGGKQVVLEFSRGKLSRFLSVHLRMTGRLIWVPELKGRLADPQACDHYQYKVPISDKSLRARFRLSGGELRFYDQRRFGVLALHSDPAGFASAGVEPLGPDFSPASLAGMLAGARGEIKPWLLRQDRIAGIGNIYASEILFACAVHPRRSAGSLSPAEQKDLHRHTVRILKLAIKHCGTTFSDFQDSTGSTGSFQQYLKVYGREGQACPVCARPLERIVQQQRSSFYCPDCQH
ncbi:bifunctional DNA-formamidopyrimidine glycosylase/DNA-(apurinic or apyrimidinic site) lyase [bacterium]|nr:bifunctional DNA-formamidopyrimidine glycosylase/DNA-(apurinic or apyrimidinic site) lyase [bacterium]